MKLLRAIRPAAVARYPSGFRPVLSGPSSPFLPSSSSTVRRHASRSRDQEQELQQLQPVSNKYQARMTQHGIAIDLPDSSPVKRRELPSFWLRDNCGCAKCVNQDTMQRNFDTFEIPSNIYPVEVTTNRESIDVTWSDKHNSSYSWKFLQYYQNNDYRAPEDIKPSLWGAEDVSQPSPGVPYDRVMADDRGVAELTSKIRKYGFAFVKGTPYDDPKYTKELLERIAFIRETHYGGFYDFTPDLAMADTAYTNLALPPHTDTTYFTDPAGLQAFHLLSHVGPPQAPPTTDETPSSSSSSDDNPTAHYEGRGGSSLLIDGFYAAEILRTKFPSAYEILSTVRLPWHASGNPGITIAPDQRFPVLELDKDTGKLHRIRWNNDDRGVVPWDEKYDPTAWYRAARRWANILKRKDVRYWVQLEPGKPLIFDNWRVLHGRSAFTGTRRICGAYINRDDFISRWRNTNFPREQILTRIIG